jgi:hypothetical protein
VPSTSLQPANRELAVPPSTAKTSVMGTCCNVDL